MWILGLKVKQPNANHNKIVSDSNSNNNRTSKLSFINALHL